MKIYIEFTPTLKCKELFIKSSAMYTILHTNIMAITHLGDTTLHLGHIFPLLCHTNNDRLNGCCSMITG